MASWLWSVIYWHAVWWVVFEGNLFLNISFSTLSLKINSTKLLLVHNRKLNLFSKSWRCAKFNSSKFKIVALVRKFLLWKYVQWLHRQAFSVSIVKKCIHGQNTLQNFYYYVYILWSCAHVQMTFRVNKNPNVNKWLIYWCHEALSVLTQL